jgi:hypothetical protein
MADVNKEIALKVTTDLGQTTAQFQNATKELQETQKALVELALAGKQGSEEFLEMENRAGQLRDAIGSVNQRINTLASSTPKLDLVKSAAQGIAAGFAVAQGAAALFGDESEDLQQAILKTQGAMTLLNGVTQISITLDKNSKIAIQGKALAQKAYTIAVRIATAATRSLSAAIAATGVGALVIGLGLLVSKLMETSAATKQSNLDLEEAAKRQKQLADEIALTNKLRQSEIDLAAAAGASAKQTALENIKLLKDNINEKQKEIDAEQKLIDQIEVNKSKVIDAQKEILDVLINQTQQKKNLLQVEFNDLSTKLKQQENIVTEYDENASKSKTDNSLKARQQVISDLEVELNFRKQFGEDVTALEERLLKEKLSYAELTKTGVMQAQAELRLFLMRDQLQFEADQKEANKKQAETLKENQIKLAQLRNDDRRAKMNDYDREREDFVLQRKTMYDLMVSTGASAMQLEAFGRTTRFELDRMDSNRRIELEKATEEEKRKLRQENINKAAQMTMDSLSALNALYTSSLGQSEKDQRRAFEANKKFSIAQALISTFLAVNNALTAGGNPIKLATGAQFVEAGIALTAGLANVIKIRKTTFQSTSAPSSSSPTAPSSAGGGQQQIPGVFNPNVTATTPTGQPNPMGSGQQPLRAYVLDRDIENSSSRRNMLRDFAAI